MLHTTSLMPMAHLICVAHSRLELADILVTYRKAGVENLMALGGDPPEDPADGPGELAHAVELVELARAIGGFSIGVAAHPAGHPASPDLAADRDRLAEKLRLADFAVTQFFFEADEYRGLVADLADRGLDKPVLPGHHAGDLAAVDSPPGGHGCGRSRPGWWTAWRRPTPGAAPTRSAGRGSTSPPSCAGPCSTLGAPGLHFYTLNRSTATREIYRALGLAPELTAAG